MHKTVLYEQHLQLGAEMIEFGSWLMPVKYENIVQEHLQTRNELSLFDTCHMGEIRLRGKQALEMLENLVPRDLSRCKDGRCYYTHLCNQQGGIIDDTIVYRINAEEFILVVNSETTEKDFKHLQEHLIGDCQIDNESTQTGKIDIQGPQAQTVIETLFGESSLFSDLPYFGFDFLKWEGQTLLISRTGYTGEQGFEFYGPNDLIVQLWQKLIAQGVKPAGLGARDTLRLEMGYPLMGSDMNENLSPLEVGASFFVSKDKDFLGKEAMFAKQNQQEQFAFVIDRGGIARHDTELVDNQGQKIGIVTSGTFSPSLNQAIGLGLSPQKFQVGDPLNFQIRKRQVQGRVVRSPFVQNTSLAKAKV